MTYTHTHEHSLQQLLLAWHTRRESTTPADTLYNDTVGGTNTHTNTHTQYYHNSVSISINGTIRVCVPVNTLLNPTHTHTGPDPSYKAAPFGGMYSKRGGSYSSRISPWKQAGEQHIPLGVLSETEDESSPHYGSQTTQHTPGGWLNC